MIAVSLLALTIPIAHAWSAATAGRSPIPPVLVAAWGLFASVGVALAWALLAGVPGDPTVQLAPDLLLGGLFALRLDGVTIAMLPVVSLIGLVIVRYSASYLDPGPAQVRYARWLSTVLAAVSMLLLTDHLVVLSAAWTLTSFALHGLLTHFRQRTSAREAAREKFLISRSADVALLAAMTLLWWDHGTLSISGLADLSGPLPATSQLAAVLVVLAVVLKTAQLPFHGWLTRVMEAPTPVSALLHAGVVNIGGVVVLRLAALITATPVASLLLVGIGSTTAVVGALVMSVQPTVKGKLAWSTIAQMGFLLVQCGLGAWSAALLHLVAHSCYKAHAFLSSGSAVETWRSLRLSTPAKPIGYRRGLLLGAASVTGLAGLAWLLGFDPTHDPSVVPLALVVALALPALAAGQAGWLATATALIGVPLLCLVWHAAFAQLVPQAAPGPWLGARLTVATTAFLGLYALQVSLEQDARGLLARTLRAPLHRGFYVDALFSRLVTTLWPVSAPASIPDPSLFTRDPEH